MWLGIWVRGALVAATVAATTGLWNGSGLATAARAAQPVVRWHGDYYQFKWISGIPGGTPRERLENRWLRGGPAAGTLRSQQGLDLDGDGVKDDSRVYYEYSLDKPLNPQGTPARPGGVYYHEDMPSAQFYGGLSAKFLNYQTKRVDQAYVENDGAGGNVADVGYSSPYLGADNADFRARIESLRHPDGRYKKSHIGPHEDIAVEIYRPSNPLPINPGDVASDNQLTFAAAFLWKKQDFLVGDATLQRVSLDSSSYFSFESTRWWSNIGQARWLVQDGNGQVYISQYWTAGQLDNWGHANVLADPMGTRWTTYRPATSDLNFNQGNRNLVWLDPVAAGLFQDVQAFGIYLEQDRKSGLQTRFSLDEIQFWATVTNRNALLSTQAAIHPVAEPASWVAFGGTATAAIGVAVTRSRKRVAARGKAF